MKKILSFFATLAWCVAAFAADGWQDVKGDHFIVYYKTNEAFAREVSHNAEKYYTRIAADLGYQRYSDFWQWDKRVKIWIYPTQAEFQKATGEQAWSHGMAKYSTKEIFSYNASEGFMDGLLPHEIAHLVFRDFVGLKGEIPLWIDEGVAQWEEPAKRADARKFARYLISQDIEFPIQDLMTTDVRGVSDENKVYAFYMQSVSLVDFLIARYGASAFTDFCRALRDGKKFGEALRIAYPNRIEDLPDLEVKWRDYVMTDPETLEVYKKL